MKFRSTFLQKFAAVSAAQGKCNGTVFLRHNNTILVQHEGMKQLPIYLTMTTASQLIGLSQRAKQACLFQLKQKLLKQNYLVLILTKIREIFFCRYRQKPQNKLICHTVDRKCKTSLCLKVDRNCKTRLFL